MRPARKIKRSDVPASCTPPLTVILSNLPTHGFPSNGFASWIGGVCQYVTYRIHNRKLSQNATLSHPWDNGASFLRRRAGPSIRAGGSWGVPAALGRTSHIRQRLGSLPVKSADRLNAAIQISLDLRVYTDSQTTLNHLSLRATRSNPTRSVVARRLPLGSARGRLRNPQRFLASLGMTYQVRLLRRYAPRNDL